VVLDGWRGGPAPTDAHRAQAALERAARAASRAADLGPVLEQLRGEGTGSLGALAAVLNSRGIPGRRGGRWTATAVWRVMARLATRSPAEFAA
jgi:Recombinase-like helix-turn-helix domain